MIAATILGCSTVAARSQSDEELRDLLPLLRPWESLLTVKSGGGYKDNVALSHAAPEAGGFVSAAAEAMVLRQFLEGSQLTFFASGETRFFPSAKTVDDEATAFAVLQGKKLFTDGSQGTLAAQYVFENEVLDVSITETNREAVPVRGHSIGLRPGYHKDLGERLRLSLELPATRQFLNAPLDDYWEAGPRCTLARRHGHESEVGALYEFTFRAYDTYTQLDASGATVTNTSRVYWQNNFRLHWRQHWDAAKHWRTELRAGCRVNTDNGSGYFDFVEPHVSIEARYRTGDWTLVASARAGWYFYPVQTVSATDPAKRERADLHVSVRGERRLWRKLSALAAFEHEQVYSNDRLETYTANIFQAGLQWEF